MYAILYDSSLCIGCRACQVACKRWNGLEADETEGMDFGNPQSLTSNTWNVVKYVWVEEENGPKLHFVVNRCMHCLEPVCEAVCPVRAIVKDRETGAVVTHPERCVGCLACVEACPFSVPKFGRGVGTRKCIMCIDRLRLGLEPACVSTCPTGALKFGERSEIIKMAEERAKEIGGYVYGVHEAGGTSVIMVLTAPPEKLGLPTPMKAPYVKSKVSGADTLLKEATSMLTGSGVGESLVLALGAAIVGGVIARRMKISRKEG
ncbi:MAG: 4Fe-4S ferredoxin [Thermoprotei archaeon]|nr:MAG: 4Fe-4S ferredoxin [Thermoprotei archaeon]